MGFNNISVPSATPEVKTVDMKQTDVNKMVDKLALLVSVCVLASLTIFVKDGQRSQPCT